MVPCEEGVAERPGKSHDGKTWDYGECQMKKSRLQFLDALRGIAVLLVIFAHFTQDQSAVIKTFGSSIFQIGQAGVSLFFLISGYIIPRSINGAPSLAVFWARRVMRLYPIYWVSILAALILVWLGLFRLPAGVGLVGVALNLTMLQGFVGVSDVIGVFWSLKFEMAFYFLMTGIAYSKLLCRPLEIFLLYTASILVAAGAFVLADRHFPYGMFHLYMMLLGWVLGEWHSQNVSTRAARVATVLATITAIACAYAAFHGRLDFSGYGTLSFIPMLTAWVGAIALFVVVLSVSSDLYVPNWLAWIGVTSYSSYLLHILVLSAFGWLATDLGAMAIPLWFAIAFGVSGVTYRLIEKPMVDLGHRRFGRRFPSIAGKQDAITKP